MTQNFLSPFNMWYSNENHSEDSNVSDVEDLSQNIDIPLNHHEKQAKRRAYQRKWVQNKRKKNNMGTALLYDDCLLEYVSDSSECENSDTKPGTSKELDDGIFVNEIHNAERNINLEETESSDEDIVENTTEEEDSDTEIGTLHNCSGEVEESSDEAKAEHSVEDADCDTETNTLQKSSEEETLISKKPAVKCDAFKSDEEVLVNEMDEAEVETSLEENSGDDMVENIVVDADSDRETDTLQNCFEEVILTSKKPVEKCNTLDSDDEIVNEIDEAEVNANLEQSDEDMVEGADDLMLPKTIRDHKGPLWFDLREAVYTSRMNTVQTDAILSVLHRHKSSIAADIPKSYKSLMKIGKESFRDSIRLVSGHYYYYYSLTDQLKFYLNCYPESVTVGLDTLNLVWNTDGLPLHNSTRWCSWPVLCYIQNLKPRIVFEVVLTSGEGKPTNLDYLVEFISDLKYLMSNGLLWKDRLYNVAMRAAVCDAPARAQIKHIKQFSSRYGCDHCEKQGEHDGKRITWVGSEGAIARTDESFRSKRQKEHHHNDGMFTPLLSLNVDMISAFPPDFMHQAGGTMKKILLWIIRGPKKSGNHRHHVKMSARNIQILNQRIEMVRQCIPNMFSRKLRTTVDAADYKYTELRQLLLYTGKVLFLDLMASEKQYENFIKYSVACCLMVDNETAETYHGVYDFLMKQVVDEFSEIYGQAFMMYNVHANLHFPAVAICHGSLDNVSAYPFENHLGQLKRYITSPHNPLVALMKGIQRRQAVEKGKIFTQPKPVVYLKNPDNIYIDHHQHKCYEALSIVGNKVKCMQFTRIQPFFEHPVPSTVIGCYKVQLNCWRLKYIPVTNLHMLRRGLKINLNKLHGITEPNDALETAIFMSVLHNQQDCLY